MTEDYGEAPPRWTSPSTPKKVKIESEEPKELLKDEDHSEEESREIEDEDGPPPGWQHSPPPSPPLLDMVDFPHSSPLPPTPPLPSSPRDLDMEQQDSEDEGPPPGWDNKYQLQEQAEQLVTSAVISANLSDIQTEDVREDSGNEEGQPRFQAHSSPPPEIVTSAICEETDTQVEEQDSEDDGPPPGWDSKCQPEPRLEIVHPTTPRSDIKMEDIRKDDKNEVVPSDIELEQQDSEDDGPPPGWDSKCQPEPKLQTECPNAPRSDIKMEDVQLDARNEDGFQPQSQTHPSPPPELVSSDIQVDQQDSEDEGPPPGWDSKSQLEPKLQTANPTTPRSDISDIKTEDVQLDARNEDGPQPQSQPHPSSATERVSSDVKVEQQDSENEGPPPGWDSKCQQPEPLLPTTPPSGTECEQKNVKIVEERPQSPSRQLSILPTKPHVSAPKPQTTIDNPEMGQMVCGSCRHLLSYPRGARYVECACCLEENYVLEEHEVGQVVCGGCNVLLMYPYGAPKVRCANCSIETEIGDQNRRPPLSEHKIRARRHLKRVQAG